MFADRSASKRATLIDDKVAGYVSSWSQGDKRLVAYWLGRAYWGQGIATAALAEFLAHDATRPLHAFVAVRNDRDGHRLRGLMAAPT